MHGVYCNYNYHSSRHKDSLILWLPLHSEGNLSLVTQTQHGSMYVQSYDATVDPLFCTRRVLSTGSFLWAEADRKSLSWSCVPSVNTYHFSFAQRQRSLRDTWACHYGMTADIRCVLLPPHLFESIPDTPAAHLILNAAIRAARLPLCFIHALVGCVSLISLWKRHQCVRTQAEVFSLV